MAKFVNLKVENKDIIINLDHVVLVERNPKGGVLVTVSGLGPDSTKLEWPNTSFEAVQRILAQFGGAQ